VKTTRKKNFFFWWGGVFSQSVGGGGIRGLGVGPRIVLCVVGKLRRTLAVKFEPVRLVRANGLGLRD